MQIKGTAVRHDAAQGERKLPLHNQQRKQLLTWMLKIVSGACNEACTLLQADGAALLEVLVPVVAMARDALPALILLALNEKGIAAIHEQSSVLKVKLAESICHSLPEAVPAPQPHTFPSTSSTASRHISSSSGSGSSSSGGGGSSSKTSTTSTSSSRNAPAAAPLSVFGPSAAVLDLISLRGTHLPPELLQTRRFADAIKALLNAQLDPPVLAVVFELITNAATANPGPFHQYLHATALGNAVLCATSRTLNAPQPSAQPEPQPSGDAANNLPNLQPGQLPAFVLAKAATCSVVVRAGANSPQLLLTGVLEALHAVTKALCPTQTQGPGRRPSTAAGVAVQEATSSHSDQPNHSSPPPHSPPPSLFEDFVLPVFHSLTAALSTTTTSSTNAAAGTKSVQFWQRIASVLSHLFQATALHTCTTRPAGLHAAVCRLCLCVPPEAWCPAMAQAVLHAIDTSVCATGPCAGNSRATPTAVDLDMLLSTTTDLVSVVEHLFVTPHSHREQQKLRHQHQSNHQSKSQQQQHALLLPSTTQTRSVVCAALLSVLADVLVPATLQHPQFFVSTDLQRKFFSLLGAALCLHLDVSPALVLAASTSTGAAPDSAGGRKAEGAEDQHQEGGAAAAALWAFRRQRELRQERGECHKGLGRVDEEALAAIRAWAVRLARAGVLDLCCVTARLLPSSARAHAPQLPVLRLLLCTVLAHMPADGRVGSAAAWTQDGARGAGGGSHQAHFLACFRQLFEAMDQQAVIALVECGLAGAMLQHSRGSRPGPDAAWQRHQQRRQEQQQQQQQSRDGQAAEDRAQLLRGGSGISLALLHARLLLEGRDAVLGNIGVPGVTSPPLLFWLLFELQTRLHQRLHHSKLEPNKLERKRHLLLALAVYTLCVCVDLRKGLDVLLHGSAQSIWPGVVLLQAVHIVMAIDLTSPGLLCTKHVAFTCCNLNHRGGVIHTHTHAHMQTRTHTHMHAHMQTRTHAHMRA